MCWLFLHSSATPRLSNENVANSISLIYCSRGRTDPRFLQEEEEEEVALEGDAEGDEGDEEEEGDAGKVSIGQLPA